jgi:hypothetical protein
VCRLLAGGGSQLGAGRQPARISADRPPLFDRRLRWTIAIPSERDDSVTLCTSLHLHSWGCP